MTKNSNEKKIKKMRQEQEKKITPILSTKKYNMTKTLEAVMEKVKQEKINMEKRTEGESGIKIPDILKKMQKTVIFIRFSLILWEKYC